MGKAPRLASNLLYGRRLSYRRETPQSLQYSDKLSYRQFVALIESNLLPLPMRRAFEGAHIVGRAESCSDRYLGSKTVVTLTGIVPDRRLVLTFYNREQEDVISIDYEAQLNLFIPGPGVELLLAIMTNLITDNPLLEICSTSPKTLERLIDDYPSGWLLSRYRGDRRHNQVDCLSQLAKTTMISPGDSRELSRASNFDQLVSRQRGRDALLNCNQYVALYLLRPLDDLSGHFDSWANIC